jgi:MinD-like ATPase involved in chromosome partitioning or flagellar assembly
MQGAHYSRIPEISQRPSVDRIYAVHVQQLRRANPSIIVPTRRKSENTFAHIVGFIADYLLPTAYMRFALVRMYYKFLIRIRVDKKFTPYVPQPSLRKRKALAILRMRRIIFRHPKVIASFHTGGGVGKTTTVLLRGLAIKRTLPYLDVSVVDCDDGTLIQRVERTSKLSVLDFLANLSQIVRNAHLLAYCTVTKHGLKVMAYRRDDQLDDVSTMSRDEMSSVIEKATSIEDIVLCDLGPNKAEWTRGALDKTHQIQIVTTPAEDRLDQAVSTFSWLLENGYRHLATTAIILVNNYKSQKDIEKVKKRFEEKHHMHMNDVRFTAIRHSGKLGKGGKITQSLLSRREEVLLLENTATLMEGLADAFVDDHFSQMTHLEELAHSMRTTSERVERIAQKGIPTPPSISPTVEAEKTTRGIDELALEVADKATVILHGRGFA